MSNPDKQAQRVRVGLTGLACVFLLVMLAAVFLRATGADSSAGHNVIASAPKAAEAPNEPLATLGVAPGSPAPTPATPPVSPGPHPKTLPAR